MPPPLREFFTVDLRGLRAALAARAASNGLTESDVLRSALATSLGERTGLAPSSADGGDVLNAARIKLSVRLTKPASYRLDRNARAAGLSRGAYLTRLVESAPPVVASSDRAVMCKALSGSSAELAVLSRDISHLTQFLRQGSVEAARLYVARLEALDTDVRRHLALAAPVLAELSSTRPGAKRALGGRRPRTAP